MQVPVPFEMQAYTGAVLARLRYLYPNHLFDSIPNAIVVNNCTEAEFTSLCRDVSYLFYREKIYGETLPLRRQLLQALVDK